MPLKVIQQLLHILSGIYEQNIEKFFEIELENNVNQ